MDFRYTRFDPTLLGLRALLEHLERVLSELLLHTDGDVEEALRWLERIGQREGWFGEGFSLDDFRRWLERRNLVRPGEGGTLQLASRGEQSLRAGALESLFGSLRSGMSGDHRIPPAGTGVERLPETRPWEFGDTADRIATNETLANALRRGGLDELSIEEQDLEVFETEHQTSCATVLAIDVSHSMILYGEDRFTPAKRVALALTELVRTRYPKDALDVVLFGDEAWRVPLDELPYVRVGPFHTNTRAALVLAREILRKRRQENRQILMVTDGKPSCLTEPGGGLYKNPFGLDRRIVNKTLEEAEACRRHRIPITTFMLTDDPTLVDFVETFTRQNRGRAYFSRPGRLGSFLLVDFLRNRRTRSSR